MASVAPRQLFFQSRLPEPTSAAQVPSKQPPPSPALAKYTRSPLVSMSLTRETQPGDGSGTALAAGNACSEPSSGSRLATDHRGVPLTVAKLPPANTLEPSSATSMA